MCSQFFFQTDSHILFITENFYLFIYFITVFYDASEMWYFIFGLVYLTSQMYSLTNLNKTQKNRKNNTELSSQRFFIYY